MPVARQSASVMSKMLSGGGNNYAVPPAWSQTMYGSGWPIAPVSAPKDVEIPRQIDFPIAVNTTLVPRISYGLMPFAALLEAYENVSEVSAPVRLIHRELTGFLPHLVDEEGNTIEDHPYAWMTEYPDRRTPFGVWMTRFLKSSKVYDAPAVYLQRGKSGIDALHYIDGSTLFVIVDQFGNTPEPEPVEDYVRRVSGEPIISAPKVTEGTSGPSTLADFASQYITRQRSGLSVPTRIPAYTQIIKGTPFSWWDAEDIWYMPQSRRINAPYGESFIELAWSWIMIIVNITAFELGHYRTGNMPEGFVTVPKDMFQTPDQIMAAELLYNQRMTSNPATERNRIRIFPDGSKYFPTKKPDFPRDLYAQAKNNILDQIGVLPSEFGDIPGGGLGGAGFKEGAESDTGRHTINPARDFIASVFNYVLARDGVDDVYFSLDYPSEEINPDKQRQAVYEGMAHGTLSLNEALGQLNLNPVGDPKAKDNIANKHMIVAGSTIFVIEDMQTENGTAVPSFAPVQGGMAGGEPVGPETVVEQEGKEHTPQDMKTLQEAIRNMQERGTLDNKFVSVPSGRVLFKTEEEPADTRLSQIQVGYVEAASNPAERCALCRFFIAGGSCQLVQGAISEDGWCKLFEAKALSQSPREEEPIDIEIGGFATKLGKVSGVDPDDDAYFGALISRETGLVFPNGDHANSVEIVAMTPDGLPPKPALWKPEGGEMSGLQSFIGGAQYVREEAAYILDRSLAFYLVPVAYVAEVSGEHGAAVMYAPGSLPGKPVDEYMPEWIERAAVLDFISGQQDRGASGHNYLTHSEDLRRPILFDNGLSFPVNTDVVGQSGFCSAWSNQPLSEIVLAALTLCKGDASAWSDIGALVGKTAAANALARLEQVLEAKALPVYEVMSVADTDGSWGL